MGTLLPDALLVFAKTPSPGAVKTRLTPPLSAEEAATLYRAFLFDALDQYARLPVAVRLYVAEGSVAFPEEDIPRGITYHVQRGEGLGARLQQAFLETFAAGHTRIIVVGTDHPSLPQVFVEQAFEALRTPLQIVLGPSDDGGYYLLGKNEFYPQLFLQQYSHEQVFMETMARAGTTQAQLTILPPWYDVDDATSLRRLIAEVRTGDVVGPRTRAAVEALCARYPELE